MCTFNKRRAKVNEKQFPVITKNTLIQQGRIPKFGQNAHHNGFLLRQYCQKIRLFAWCQVIIIELPKFQILGTLTYVQRSVISA